MRTDGRVSRAGPVEGSWEKEREGWGCVLKGDGGGAVGVSSKKYTGLCTVWEGERHGFAGAMVEVGRREQGKERGR